MTTLDPARPDLGTGVDTRVQERHRCVGPVRSRHVVAMSVPIVYNNDGDCDRDGLVFAVKPHQPLLEWIRDQLAEADFRLLRLHVARQRTQVVIDGVRKLDAMVARLADGDREEKAILDRLIRAENEPRRAESTAIRRRRGTNESDRSHAIRTNVSTTIDEVRAALLGLGATWTRSDDRYVSGIADDLLAGEVFEFDGVNPAGVEAALEVALDGLEPQLPLVTLTSEEREFLVGHWTVQRDLLAAAVERCLAALRFDVAEMATRTGLPRSRVRQLMVNDWSTSESGRSGDRRYDRVNPLKPIPVVAPLVLRARRGECVHITLENQVRGRRVGLHIQGDGLGRVEHGDGVRFGDGSHVGANPDSTVREKGDGRAARIEYAYAAGHEGVWMLGDTADVRGSEQGSNIHGLFGAIIVEPPHTTWRDPVTKHRLDNQQHDSQLDVDVIARDETIPGEGTTTAEIPAYVDFHSDDIPRSYREFTVFIHDEPEVHSGIHAAGLHSWMPLSYRAEPMVNRLPHRMRRLVDATDKHPDPNVAVDRQAFGWTLGEEYDDEFWTARTPDGRWLERIAGEEQHHSSWLFGEPATPVQRAYAGDPCRIRLVHGGIKETHVYHLHVHQWRAVAADTAPPSVWGTDEAGRPKAKGSQLLDSITISPQAAMTIDPLYGSGSRQHAPGDIIWHCHLYPHFHHGMWGLWRSFDRLVDGTRPYPDGTPCPALQALPGRDPLAPTVERPGFPWFIDGVHPMKSPPPPAPVDEQMVARRRMLGLGHASATELAAMPHRIRSGEISSPGAVFVDLDRLAETWNAAAELPPPRIVSYDLHSEIDPITYNSGGWHDPRGCHYRLGRVEVRERDDAGHYRVTHTREFARAPGNPEPTFPRANHGDVVELRMHNELRALSADQEDLAMHPVECGLHVHLVKFDVLSADGSATGWNYLSGASCHEAVESAPDGALPRNVSLHRWVVDEEFGPCFFHDHLLANYRQKHGLWSALIAEPHGSQWHRVDDQSEPAWGEAQAVVVPPDSTGLPPFREACLGVQDFVPLQDRHGRALNPPSVLSGVDDPGVMAVSYRSNPMHFRGRDPSTWFSVTSQTRNNLAGRRGEPDTPLIETYPGERLRIRVIQGSHEEGHSFQINGLRWRRDWGNHAAPVVNHQTIGISEAFTLDIDPWDASPYGVGDHLWHLGGLDDLWLGCWGYVRALPRSTANLRRLAPLPTTARSPVGTPPTPIPAKATGPADRTFVVVAQRTEHLFRGAHLTDPWGLIYRVAHFDPHEWERARSTGIYRPSRIEPDDRPLVLRAHRGERIRVIVVNDLLNDDPAQAAVLPRFSVETAPPRLFVEHVDELGRPDRRTVSPRISLNASLLRYDVRSADGSYVGRNPDQTVAPAPSRDDHGAHVEGAGPVVHRGGHDGPQENWREYVWFADDELAPQSHADGPGRVCVLMDLADVRNHRHHGLIGALVVEPADVFPWQPGSWRPGALADEADGWHGVEAELRNEDGHLVAGEGVVFFQDGLRHFLDGQPSQPVSDGALEDENELDSGQKAISYRTALIHRGRPPTGAAAGAPLITAKAGVPLWLRVVGAGDKLRQHCLTLHDLTWSSAPWVPEAARTASASGVVGGWSEDVVIHPEQRGDHVLRTGAFRFGTEMGVWNVIRVR